MMNSSQPCSPIKSNPWLKLNLPPELAQRALIVTGVSLLAIILLTGWAISQLRAANAPPTVKIALVAPFEGLYRTTGYEMLFAVKQAIAERNQAQGLAGFRVELVALNDFNNPAEAARQAQALAADPVIVGVVGHSSPEATLAALPAYRQAGLAVVSPWSLLPTAAGLPGVVSVAATTAETNARLQSQMERQGAAQIATITTPAGVKNIPAGAQAVQLAADAVTAGNILLQLQATGNLLPVFGQAEAGNGQLVQVAGPAANGLVFVSPGPAAANLPGDSAFAQAYQAAAGYPPSPRAILAYDAAQVLLNSIEQTMNLNQKWYNYAPSRIEISHMLGQSAWPGLTGLISFDAAGRRVNAPVWVYKIAEVRYPGSLIER